MTNCPSQLVLEEYLMDPGAGPTADHVASCADCGQRLAEMRRLSGEFRQIVYPETARAVLDSVDRPSWIRSLVRCLTPPALAATAAICMLVFVGHGPVQLNRADAHYVGTKGAPFSLAVFAPTLDGSEPLTDGSRVKPGTALRFEVRAPASACRLWLVSIDDLNQVSRLYPPAGAAAPHRGGALPGGALLDDRTGPERIFAVCSRDPLDYGVVERAVRVAAAGDVRAAQRLGGLPAGVLQTTVLLEKTR